MYHEYWMQNKLGFIFVVGIAFVAAVVLVGRDVMVEGWSDACFVCAMVVGSSI